MARLKFPSQKPPGGWKYLQPQTRLWFNGDDQGVVEMAEQIAKHRVFRKLPRATPREAMEDIHEQLCQRLGGDHCMPNDGENWNPIKKDYSNNLDGEQAVAFTKTFLSFIKEGGATAPMTEAARRSSICKACPMNIKSTGCASCSFLQGVINGVIPTSMRIEGLHVCAVCGCGLQAKVLMTKEVIAAGDAGRDLVYPPNCWIPPLLAT
jgi:hypothetical protein